MVVRPDQCEFRSEPFASPSPFSYQRARSSFPSLPSADVGLVVGLEDTARLDAFCARFMVPDPNGGFPGSAVEKVLPPDWTDVTHQDVQK